MAQIVPAILERTIEGFLSKEAEIVKIPQLKKIQVDFCDGKFTENRTVQASELPVLNPLFEWEAHLMLVNPEEHFFDLKLLGFKSVVFHFEAVKKEQIQNLANGLRELKLSAGIAINPETSIEELLPYLDFFDEVLVLGVHPGLQGQELLPETAERIKKLKNARKNLIIEEDGGLNLATRDQLVAAGADDLVAGSALYAECLTPQQNYEKLAQ